MIIKSQTESKKILSYSKDKTFMVRIRSLANFTFFALKCSNNHEVLQILGANLFYYFIPLYAF